jgi:hypothetical protein
MGKNVPKKDKDSEKPPPPADDDEDKTEVHNINNGQKQNRIYNHHDMLVQKPGSGNSNMNIVFRGLFNTLLQYKYDFYQNDSFS